MQRALPPLLLLLLAAILLGPGPAREAEAAAAGFRGTGEAQASHGNGAALQQPQLEPLRVPRGDVSLLQACATAGMEVVITVPAEAMAEPADAMAWLRVLYHAMAEARSEEGSVELSSPLVLRSLDAASASALGFSLSAVVLLDVPPSLLLSKDASTFSELLAMAPDNVPVWCTVTSRHQLAGAVTLRGEGNHDLNSGVLPRETATSSAPLRPRSSSTVPFFLHLAGESDGNGAAAEASAATATTASSGSRRRELATLRTWCVAKSNANPTQLQDALNWACGPGGADCAILQSGQACFSPNTLQAHASYAFNSYYQTHGFASSTCDFGGTATTTNTDPSTAGCTYPSSDSSASVSSSGGSSAGNAGYSIRPCFSVIAWLSLLVFSGLQLAMAGL